MVWIYYNQNIDSRRFLCLRMRIVLAIVTALVSIPFLVLVKAWVKIHIAKFAVNI